MNCFALRQCARLSPRRLASARNAPLARTMSGKAAFDWQDPLSFKSLLTEDELAISETAEKYCQDKLQPRVLGLGHQTLITYDSNQNRGVPK